MHTKCLLHIDNEANENVTILCKSKADTNNIKPQLNNPTKELAASINYTRGRASNSP